MDVLSTWFIFPAVLKKINDKRYSVQDQLWYLCSIRSISFPNLSFSFLIMPTNSAIIVTGSPFYPLLHIDLIPRTKEIRIHFCRESWFPYGTHYWFQIVAPFSSWSFPTSDTVSAMPHRSRLTAHRHLPKWVTVSWFIITIIMFICIDYFQNTYVYYSKALNIWATMKKLEDNIRLETNSTRRNESYPYREHWSACSTTTPWPLRCTTVAPLHSTCVSLCTAARAASITQRQHNVRLLATVSAQTPSPGHRAVTVSRATSVCRPPHLPLMGGGPRIQGRLPAHPGRAGRAELWGAGRNVTSTQTSSVPTTPACKSAPMPTTISFLPWKVARLGGHSAEGFHWNFLCSSDGRSGSSRRSNIVHRGVTSAAGQSWAKLNGSRPTLF